MYSFKAKFINFEVKYQLSLFENEIPLNLKNWTIEIIRSRAMVGSFLKFIAFN